MSRTYRACWSSYLILTICVGALPTIALMIALHGDHGAAEVAAAGFAVLLFIYFWLSRFRLTITPDNVIYSSLYTGERTINLAEVEGSEMIYQSGFYGGRYLLEVNARGIKTRINFKVFSRDAVRALFHLVGPNQSLEPTAGPSR